MKKTVVEISDKDIFTGLVVMGDDACLRGRGFESQYQILDGHFFTLISCKKIIV